MTLWGHRLQPHGRTRMTRGRCGSLRFHRDGLAPSTFRRSVDRGARWGQVLSGVRQVRGADVFRPTEGKMVSVVIARHEPAPRRRRP